MIELFREVQLPDPEEAFYKYPHQLSGGQKQRVMIAMAMSCNPSVLIADEPTTALDVTVQKEILKLIKSLQDKHDMTVIFISHDLGVISEIANDVIVMYKGEIVESGPVKQIFEKPQHPYTKGLIACRPSLNYPYRKLPTINDFLSGNIENLKKEFKLEDSDKTDKTGDRRAILDIKNLKTYFPINKGIFSRTKGFNKAVDDISFMVNEGETFGLVGESGCGKTTLGRSILRLIEPTSGDVFFQNKDIKQLSSSQLRAIRKNMQIIFQDPYSSLNPRISIGNAIEEPLKVHKICKGKKDLNEKVNDLLCKVGLDETYYGRYPHELSGGQRQRICIARALAVNPKFIVCDESVSALDVSVQAQILNLLNDLKRELGLTYIFISHDLSVVKFMSDRMMVMKEGKMMEIGTAEEIYNNPKTEYTKRLIDAIPGKE
ncbi:dipeptide ABC transporter ATP-binding protein [Bacteroidota bacterium]